MYMGGGNLCIREKIRPRDFDEFLRFETPGTQKSRFCGVVCQCVCGTIFSKTAQLKTTGLVSKYSSLTKDEPY